MPSSTHDDAIGPSAGRAGPSTRGSITIYSSIGFVWFSTRLFGSLRTVLASVFDIESERGIIAGKIFDVKITVVSTLLFVAMHLTEIGTYWPPLTGVAMAGVAALLARTSTGSLLPAMVLHASYNGALTLVIYLASP